MTRRRLWPINPEMSEPQMPAATMAISVFRERELGGDGLRGLPGAERCKPMLASNLLRMRRIPKASTSPKYPWLFLYGCGDNALQR